MSSTDNANLETLKSMGYSEDMATTALAQTNNNIQLAVELLSDPSGFRNHDNEFDLLPDEEELGGVHSPTVFRPRTERDGPDHFLEGSATIAEQVDSRISSLTAMGFTAEQAEQALRECNNDMNDALNKLLAGN